MLFACVSIICLNTYVWVISNSCKTSELWDKLQLTWSNHATPVLMLICKTLPHATVNLLPERIWPQVSKCLLTLFICLFPPSANSFFIENMEYFLSLLLCLINSKLIIRWVYIKKLFNELHQLRSHKVTFVLWQVRRKLSLLMH